MSDITINQKARRALLLEEGVRRDLERRGAAIRAAAGPLYEAQTWRGRQRWRVTVRPAVDQARSDPPTVLLRALSAGRG